LGKIIKREGLKGVVFDHMKGEGGVVGCGRLIKGRFSIPMLHTRRIKRTELKEKNVRESRWGYGGRHRLKREEKKMSATKGKYTAAEAYVVAELIEGAEMGKEKDAE